MNIHTVPGEKKKSMRYVTRESHCNRHAFESVPLALAAALLHKSPLGREESLLLEPWLSVIAVAATELCKGSFSSLYGISTRYATQKL